MTSPLIVDVPDSSDFSFHNIPFGVVSIENSSQPFPASAIGEFVINLRELAVAGLFDRPLLRDIAPSVFSATTLTLFLQLGRPSWREARQTIQTLLLKSHPSPLRDDPNFRSSVLIPIYSIQHHLPVRISNYTDFYASKEHATNVGAMFRGKDNALMPNWVHIPVGYHGRASSVVISGTPITRPSGLRLDPVTKAPVFGKCQKLDFELEMGFVVGVGNELGKPINIKNADDHIFGVVLLNDWSARDIQQFEYVPLGPFLGKNFGTSISPWIVTLDALEPFRVAQPTQEPTPAEYLQGGSKDAYDINLTVQLKASTTTTPQTISQSNLKYMYWTFNQQLAHHTVNGCNMQTGDLCGTGTISGPTPDSLGSLLEMTQNGTQPITVDAVSRTFIEDGDEVILRGWCESEESAGEKIRVGFGEVTGIIRPARS
ncbi:hypothetical protein HK097_005918 [Rhizophlyctis rosea]|uniref:Fumarylacetoacetase n=1 Tax=Rhizophlyctis rosea TaxID=64517 RepID=A0AAD5X2A8_9FUNG|nr:hypothetical protein HK097_005918 [Rhizophlyctis rosea]